MNNNIMAAGISSIIEVVTTHPLDYAKTLKQNNSFSVKHFIRNPYEGIYSRIIGIIPLRIVYWNSINYFSNKGFNSINTGLLTSFFQTMIDYPMEQKKINMMLSSKVYFNPIGYSMLLARNSIFAVAFTCSINMIDDNRYNGAVGGLLGSILSHPIDSLKTYYQVGNNRWPKHWKLNNYMNGLFYRCGVSIIGMNVGYYSYNHIIDNIDNFN